MLEAAEPGRTPRLQTLRPVPGCGSIALLPGSFNPPTAAHVVLAERALAWEHVRKGLLPGGDRPLVAWADPWRDVVETMIRGPYLGGGADAIVWVEGVEEAVDAIRRRVG